MTCSGQQKETTMILKVDLQCCQCYKKIKKIICKFPQIRDQVYDEKRNTVTITVVCCNPERFMDKLCSKGRKTIKSIEIKVPPPAPKTVKPNPVPTPIIPEKPNPKPAAPAPEPKMPKPSPVPVHAPRPIYTPTPAPAPAPAAEPVAQWIPGYHPQAVCCGSCYEGRPGGPCYQYGRPPNPPGYSSSCCDYFVEDNPSACAIM